MIKNISLTDVFLDVKVICQRDSRFVRILMPADDSFTGPELAELVKPFCDGDFIRDICVHGASAEACEVGLEGQYPNLHIVLKKI